MVGPIRNRRTNFHSIADLARSDSSPYSRVPELHSSTEKEETAASLASIPFLKVKMEPSPAQSLNVTSYSTPTRAVVGDLVETPSPRSPTLSEDSGYDQENSSTSQHSEDVDHDAVDETNAEKLRKYRKQRTVFESSQLKTLEDTFAINAYPSSEEYESISAKISIDEARLRIWFQNRRARYRRSAKSGSSRSQSPACQSVPFHMPTFASPAAIPRLPSFTSSPAASHLMMYGAHPFMFPGF